MNILRNKCVTNNISSSTPMTMEHEYTTADFFRTFSIVDIHGIFNSDIIEPIFRLYLLDDDENIQCDISADFISGNLQRTYQSGTRATLSVSLINSDSKYTKPNSVTYLYFGKKFRLDVGIVLGKSIYWFQQGIFVMQEPTFKSDDSEQTISFSLSDKFALFSGTVNGSMALKTILPVGVPMKQAFINILTLDKGNGQPYDKKPVVFNTSQADTETQKTVKLDFNSNIGDALLECAKTISSDVYYDVYGNMTVESNVKEFLNNNSPVIFRIDEEDKTLVDSSVTYNWSKLRNKIIVKGAIVNGYQFSATAENTNVLSPFSANNSFVGTRAEVITNNKLYSDILCKEQAMYSLFEKQRGVKSLSLSCNYLPFLNVNSSILINLPSLNLFNQNFVIDSFSMSISDTPNTNISLTNTEEVIF